ncbi:MOSC domain-containing protein [Novosphingobium sp. M1R2S20]|uniref:MOSC domain-containing protein n=1 Tax=Novosphingobium rhizovicinum TaxID=3228928 RepID=A0ABV3RDH6_9SPHN
MTTPILSINCGKVAPFRGSDSSAIGKWPVEGHVHVERLGLAGDEQADRSVHGGPDKAIHHYPHDHYAWWAQELPECTLLSSVGAFGENVSTEGLAEDVVCIGDTFRLGTALVEVSQGRQPCWKLDHRFDGAPMMKRMISSRRSGWYYRVLEEGSVGAQDALVLVDRPFPDWSVARVFGLLVAGGHKRDRAGLEALYRVKPLSEAWKKRRAALLGN